MAKVIDPGGVSWKVSRQWIFDFDGDIDGDNDELLVLGLLVIVWPFWFLAHWFGLPWVIAIKRGKTELRTERVRGWGASERRIQEIARTAADGTWRPWSTLPAGPRRPGHPKHLAEL